SQYTSGTASGSTTTAISSIEFSDGSPAIDLTRDGLTFAGTTGDDTLFGSNQSHFLNGEDGNDTITDGAGASTINGGAGDDNMSGGSGLDVYVFDPGFGNDTINESAGTNGGIIRFGAGIGPNDIRLFRDPSDPR
ncbi:calcium-binding protein, partial [uncultured Roseibium sp.]|uniref:calcium-binding protein n=1 Tax=uncultured Roseibium sp. TaxID=1936171 RepID=UPI00345D27B6